MSRESVVVGLGFPVCVSETGTRQSTVGLVMLSQTVAAASGSAIKTFDGLVYASTKTVDGLALASVKSYNGLA